MNKSNYILKNINILNILLLVAILIFINYTILPLFNTSVRLTLPSGKKPPVHKDEKTDESTVLLLTDYTLIAEENLFHPERKITTEEAEVPPAQKPEFVLYGTLITDDMSLAYLSDLKAPYSTLGRGERQLVLRLGSTLSGYTLSEIHHDKVLMVKGDDRMEVKVVDSSKPRDRDTSIVTATEAKKSLEKSIPVSPQPEDKDSLRKRKKREKELERPRKRKRD